MAEFTGFVGLGSTYPDYLVTVDSSGQPVDPDNLPTFRVYGASGLLASAGGTVSQARTSGVTGAANASPIVVASVGSNLPSGTRVTISGVGGNTAANGTFVVTAVDADHFSLNGTTGNGSYTSGGAWKVTGFFRADVATTAGNGFDAGDVFALYYSWAVSAAARTALHSFGVT